MTGLVRYPTPATGPLIADLTLATWDSGLNPNRRWLPGKLPAVGADNVASWPGEYGSVLAPSATPKPSTAAEAGYKYADFDGVSDNLTLTGLTIGTTRTIVVIARPNTGDACTGTGYAGGGNTFFPFLNTTGLNLAQAQSADLANIVGLTSAVPATRGHWHMYGISLPDTGAGVFVVDTNSTAITSSASRNQITLTLGQQGTNYRQMRILEILTSADVFTAADLTAAYAKAKAWYPELAW
jgi:hypothetical protein